MRAVLSLVLSVAVLVSARAQSPARPETPSSTPGSFEEITIDNLQGVKISITIAYIGRTRWSSDNIVRTIQYSWRSKAQIGSAGAIEWTNDTSVRIGNDKWYPWHNSFSDIIGRPNAKPELSRDGARAVIWAFEDNILTLLRVFEKGGRITKLMFRRVGSNLDCTVTSSFLNEGGAGNPTIKAPIQGGYREYIGMKQTSATCHVTKH